MPLYPYKCTDNRCNHKWEAEQKITEHPAKHCPQCKRETAYRLIATGTSVQFKGGGWFNSGGY